MIRVDYRLREHEVLPEFVERKNDRQKLLFRGSVVPLGAIKRMAGVIDDPWLLVYCLGQTRSYGEVARVGHNLKG